MRFSVMIWPFSGDTIDPVVRLAQVAEKCGFETVYIGDSQMIWNDVWVALTCCALATERVKLGPGVTNTVTRHPAVTANAVTSLNMISGRRAVLGVGAGDSAVRTAGLSPARLTQVRERVTFMRDLLANQEVEALPPAEGKGRQTWGQVTRVRVVGTDEWGSVPIHIAVMSPKSAAVAAEIADGVIVDGHMGGNAEGAAATIDAAKKGAREAGKDFGSLRIIAAIDAAIDDDRRKALDQVRPTAARNSPRLTSSRSTSTSPPAIESSSPTRWRGSARSPAVRKTASTRRGSSKRRESPTPPSSSHPRTKPLRGTPWSDSPVRCFLTSEAVADRFTR
jgi:5,10-methylenetetrahydromethanopterin reductase